jgi:hypothetical protein
MVADETDADRWAVIGIPVLFMQGQQTSAPMPATMDALMGRSGETHARGRYPGVGKVLAANAARLKSARLSAGS